MPRLIGSSGTFAFPADAHDAWNNLDLDIDASNGTATNVNQQPTPTVTVAARVWPRAGFSPRMDWVDLMATNHGAGTESIDVSKPTKQIAPGNFPAFGEGVFLGGAVHGANIAVDDMGAVAAAATALGFQESGPPEPELTLRVDRPFLYLIRHVDSGAVMFLGEVVQL